MSSETVVSVSHVSKCYQGYAKPSHRLWQSFLGQRRKLYQEFWALQDVSLDLKRGETVGIVGKNGSGKSTLLQIIAGTLQSTSGDVETRGRISALLELGAGFNPEFTGMENARLNASILGLTREQFLERLPDIVEFSGLGDFMLRPVKTYSSGMYVRLAFAVAIHMNPDILIIDEALAVGDIRFQRKCFRRLEELKNDGVAILFVTHSADSIVNYCDRAILLDDGRILSIGEPRDVVHDYLELMFSSEAEPVLSDRGSAPADSRASGLNADAAVDACKSRPTYNPSEHRWGDRRAEIIDYRLTAGDEEVRHSCKRGALLSLRAAIHFNTDVERIIYGVTVKSADGMVIYGTNSRLRHTDDTSQVAGDLVQLEFTMKANLLGGDYFISIGVAQDDEDKDNLAIDRRYDMVHLRVEDANDAFGFASLEGDIARLPERRPPMPDILTLNSLQQNRANVYEVQEGAEPGFVYSDGADTEAYLREVLDAVEDLSSSSYELQRRIRDWPSEYHLTPKRANLLRGLDLDSIGSVLELGCGCGALTRFLGEQGMSVDAIEGAAARAELAAKRCSGLDSVNIICANFEDLEIPHDHYDLVLLVGVTEYAGRFAPGRSDEEALLDLLGIARRAIKNDGIVLVAIENRTGLKYVMGANEDHYGTKYVGIHGYPDDDGIRTYTRREWKAHVDSAGFGASEFLYPFPDYKVPTVMLSHNYSLDNPWSYCHLEGVHSRDYLSVLDLEHSEQLAWEAAVASGTLGDCSNSFCILLANDQEAIRRISSADFVHTPGFGRKAEYCTLIRKLRGEEVVRRSLLPEFDAVQHDPGIRHVPATEEDFIRGPLLSVQWSRSLLIYNDFVRFESLVKEYYRFLVARRDAGDPLTIDLVPSNIVVTGEGYRVIDEEWEVDWEITPEFLLYRSVVMFVFRHRSVVRRLAEAKRLYSPTDLVRYTFELVGLSSDFETLRGYARQDERLQDCVSEQYTPLDMEMPLVGSLHEYPPNLAVYWRKKDAGYDPALVASAQASTTTDRQTVSIDLPAGARGIDFLRFDPSGEFGQELAGFFRLYRVEAWLVGEDGSEESVWRLSGESEVSEHARLVGMNYESRDLGPGFYTVDEDAWIEFEFIPRRRFGKASHYRFEVELRYPRSVQYLIARDRFMVKSEVLDERREEIEAILEDYHDVREKLEELRNSKVWVQAERARVLVYVQLLPALGRLGEQLMRPFRALRRHGIIGLPVHLARRVQGRLFPEPEPEPEPLPPTDYENWLNERPKDYWLEPSSVNITPLVSILVPVYNPPLDIFKKTVDSVLEQTYPHWELCLADDCSTDREIRKYLEGLDNPRMKSRVQGK